MTDFSAQQRRDILEGLRSSDPASPGPLASGLRASDLIPIATFCNSRICRRFCRTLAAAGVRTRTRRDGGKMVVEVAYGARELAWEKLAEQQVAYPDRGPESTRPAFAFTMLSGIFGAVLGTGLFPLSPHFGIGVVAWVGFVVTSLLVGYLTDRILNSFRFLGRYDFGLRELLLITGVAAIVFTFWRFLADYLTRPS